MVETEIPVSTHFGHEVPYAKNWVFYSELLWKTRWDQILQMGPELNFIESELSRIEPTLCCHQQVQLTPSHHLERLWRVSPYRALQHASHGRRLV